MINTDILYLRKFYHDTYIKYKDCDEICVNDDVEALFEKYLLNQLTTLKGRLDATKKVYRINKNIPVFFYMIYINSLQKNFI